MNKPFTIIEFFSYENEVWFRKDGCISCITESDADIVDHLIDLISTFYPKAYSALGEVYKGCAMNKRYYFFRIVSRFIRCNFAQLDNIPDISDNCQCKFEFVPCPIRGECKLEYVVCRPEFDHKLSAAELPVMHLWFDGKSPDEIAEQLYLSPHTVNNHIRHAYERTGVHSRSEFIKYAVQNNLFS